MDESDIVYSDILGTPNNHQKWAKDPRWSWWEIAVALMVIGTVVGGAFVVVFR